MKCSDSNHVEDNKNCRDNENNVKAILLGRYRSRRDIQSSTVEKYKGTSKKKKNRSPQPLRAGPCRSRKIQKPREQPMPTVETPLLLPKVACKKRWNKIEVDRLKIALRAVGGPRSMQDWEKIANSINGSDRSAEEYREKAIKLRLWELSSDATIGNEIRHKRNDYNDDYFADKSYDDITLVDLNLDDSLLSVLKTPTGPAKFPRRPRLLRQVFNETRLSGQSAE